MTGIRIQMITKERLTHLKQLEVESLQVLNEVTAKVSSLVMMCLVGKETIGKG